MTPQELKDKLKDIKLPDSHRLSAWEYLPDVQSFLRVEFSIVQLAGDNYGKTPEWQRLVRFYESLVQNESNGAE